MFWAQIWVNMGYDSRPRRSCAGASPYRATHSWQLQLQHGQAAAHPVPRAVGSEECNEGVLVPKQCSVMQRCTVAAAASAPHDVQCPQPVQEPAAPASSMKQRLVAWQHSLWAWSECCRDWGSTPVTVGGKHEGGTVQSSASLGGVLTVWV
jgi:hypothetical protein